jgi:hypothetical protein
MMGNQSFMNSCHGLEIIQHQRGQKDTNAAKGNFQQSHLTWHPKKEPNKRNTFEYCIFGQKRTIEIMAQEATYLQQWYKQMKRMHKKAPVATMGLSGCVDLLCISSKLSSQKLQQ